MAAPIFIHSLFRTGSTYLFQVFRRCGDHYWCYQEPLHEVIRYAATAPEHLLELNAESGSRLRHPVLERPYFWEIYQIKDAIVPLFTKELSYDWFFVGVDHPSFPRVAAYLQSLIDNARGTPVLECCRSFGRAVALRRVFGGTHIHLWRNPWDQWWSYQVDDYFEATLHLILQATDLPPVLQSMKNKYGIADFHDPDIDKEISHALDRRLNARESYSIFYSLWLYSYIELERAAGIAINIDSLSSSPIYRERVLKELMRDGITGLDFSDCSMVARKFTSREASFFTELEGAVHESFRANGYTQQALDSALQARADHLPAAKQKDANVIDGSTVRDIAARQMDHTAWAQRQADHFAAARTHALEELDQARVSLTGALKNLEQRDAEIHAITEQRAAREVDFANVAARLDQTENELSNVLGHLRVQIAEGERLATELSVSRQNLDNVWRDLQFASGRVRELERKNTELQGTMEGFRQAYATLEQSRSWRLTAPLRHANLFVKGCRRRLATLPSAISDFPRAAATKVVKLGLHHANKHPGQKVRLKVFVGAYPGLDRILRALASSEIDNQVSRLPGVAHEAAVPTDVDSESGDNVSAFARRLHKELVSARAAADMSGDTGVREHVSH